MVAVIEVVHPFYAQRSGDCQIVALVGQHAFAYGPGTGVIVVSGANQVPAVALDGINYFENQPSREERNIVGMRLDGGQDLSGMRLTRLGSLDLDWGTGEWTILRYRAAGWKRPMRRPPPEQ